MSKLTLVISEFRRDLINHRIRFGLPVHRYRIDRACVYSAFAPGKVFGYIRWQRNEYGTQDWRIYVCQAANDNRATRLPGVIPGANVLMDLSGSQAVKRMLSHMDALEKRSGKLEKISPDYWRQLQNSKRIRKPVHALSALYSPDTEV